MKGPPSDAQAVRRTRTWMEYIAKLIVMGTMAFAVVGIIGYSVDLYRHGKEKHYIGWFSSAGFVLLTIPISMRLIVQHLTHWNAPHIQKYVVRIIWMIPIYSIESWFALRFKAASIYIETIRECYEAYVIFCFLYFLIALLGEEQALVMKLKQKPAEFGRHSWPISLVISPWAMGGEMLQKCKFGVFQYVLIKNLIAIFVCILASRGQYEEGKFRFDGFFLYQCFICNASQLWALYCLVLFYFATKDDLAPWRPVGKFLSVKTVVFFTWWQSLIIDILATPLHHSPEVDLSKHDWTNDEISKGLQDYLICIEMFFASIAFSYAFTHRDYQSAKAKSDEEEDSRPFLSAFLQSSVPDDIIADLRRFARGNSLVKRVLGDSLNAAENYDTGNNSDDEEEGGATQLTSLIPNSTNNSHSSSGVTSSSLQSITGVHTVSGPSTSVNSVIGVGGVSGVDIPLPSPPSPRSSGKSVASAPISGTPRSNNIHMLASNPIKSTSIHSLVGPHTIHPVHSGSNNNSAHSVDPLVDALAGGTSTGSTQGSLHAVQHAHTNKGTSITSLMKKNRINNAAAIEEEVEKAEKAD